tara:strand:- start:1619 stop:1891 length:273 start_codon:yes stop_codon:yes gene_type:complete
MKKINPIKEILEINNGKCIRLTLPMCKEEHIMLASSTLTEIADELFTIHKMKKPVWDKLGRSRRKISKESRNVKMYAEPESLGSSYKGAK